MPDKVDKAVIGTSTAGGVISIASGIISGAGFTSSGIAAGSTAAGMQAGIGNVVAGSAFSVLQSVTATGLVGTVGLVGGVAGVGGLAYWGGKTLYNRHKSKAKL